MEDLKWHKLQMQINILELSPMDTNMYSKRQLTNIKNIKSLKKLKKSACHLSNTLRILQEVRMQLKLIINQLFENQARLILRAQKTSSRRSTLASI